LLYTHDVSGEAMADPARRTVDLGFLRRADALIFLLDPLEFDAVRRQLPAQLWGEERPAYQLDLLTQCVSEIRQTGRNVPVCVTVSKSDLVSTYCSPRGAWQERPPNGTGWQDDIRLVSNDVRRMLVELEEESIFQKLKSAAGEGARVSFHAVSPLGAPAIGQAVPDATPVRCADPLGMALFGMTIADH
jgi:hypothetical protein